MARDESPFAWLRALEIPLGGAPSALVLPVVDPQHRPRITVPDGLRVVPLAPDESTSNDLRDTSILVLAPPVVPARPSDARFELPGGERLQGEAAVLARWLSGPLAGRSLGLFVTRSLLVAPEKAAFRSWLERAFRVRWVLFLGAAGATVLGVPGLEMGVIVLSPPSSDAGEAGARLVRLVDLEQQPPAAWGRVLRLAEKRPGGEAHDSIVLRDVDLGGDPWTYQRYSKQFERTRADAAALGDSVPLGQLATVVAGLGPKDLTAFVRESRRGEHEPTVATFGGRSLADGELGRATHMLAEHLVPSAARLEADDLLVSVHADPTRTSLTVVPVPEEALPATLEAGLLAVRFRVDTSPHVRELVQGYLASPHALGWLEAEGALPRIQQKQLERLAVPQPKEEVFEALEALARAESEYLQWAGEAREARAELFARSSFADTVPRLLERQRLERERVQAGRDSRSLDYVVRNYFPHPVAVRRESLLQRPHGEARVGQAQECAEILITVASFLAHVQWRVLESQDDDVFPPILAQYARDGDFTFDWGKHRSFLDAVLAASRRHDNPLSLPIPEMATLDVGARAPWSEAEASLRGARNKASHLYRLTPTETLSLSEKHETELCTLLAGLAFLSTVRLAVVTDYSRDPLTHERNAEVEILSGASRVFPRETLIVEAELPRSSVGVFDAAGAFRRLTPWLVWQHCPRCEQMELFALARIHGDEAEYVALATGHPWTSTVSGNYWQRLLQQAKATPTGD